MTPAALRPVSSFPSGCVPIGGVRFSSRRFRLRVSWDVRLSVHPDFPYDPLSLLQPLRSLQLLRWREDVCVERACSKRRCRRADSFRVRVPVWIRVDGVAVGSRQVSTLLRDAVERFYSPYGRQESEPPAWRAWGTDRHRRRTWNTAHSAPGALGWRHKTDNMKSKCS